MMESSTAFRASRTHILDIVSCPRRGLEEDESVLLGKLLPLLRRDCPTMLRTSEA